MIVILISPCGMDSGKPKQWWWPCKTRSEPAMCWTHVIHGLPASQWSSSYELQSLNLHCVWVLSSIRCVVVPVCGPHVDMALYFVLSFFFPAAVSFLYKKSFAVSYLKALLMSLWKAISGWFFCLVYDSLFFPEDVVAWSHGFFQRKQN